MPTFTIQLPDGRTMDAEAPDQATALQGAQQWHAANPIQPSVAGDVAKTALPATARMAAETIGGAGDVRELASLVADKTGMPDWARTAVRSASGAIPVLGPLLRYGPTSQQVQQKIEGMTGPLYEPQTPAGRVLDTSIRMAPALLGGPEALAVKLGTRVLTPAIAGEAAHQATEGTAAEPYVKPAAEITAAILAHRLTTPRVPAAITPAAGEIEAAASAKYQHPEIAAVQIQPQAVSQLADRITADLNRRGSANTPRLAGDTHTVVDQLRNTGTTPGLPQGVASVEELRVVKSSLSKMSIERDPITGRPTPNAEAAGMASRRIDAFLDGLRQPDLIAGNAQRASTILREANRDWASASKSRLIDLQQMKAERQAGKAGSGTNIENAMRQRIDQVLAPYKPSAAGLTGAEQAAADRIVMGSPLRNALRKVGKLGFGDGLSLLLHAMAAPATLGTSLLVGIPATVARKVGERMTRGEIEALDQMIRSRAPEAQRWAAMQARAPLQPPNLSASQTGLLTGAVAAPRGLLLIQEEAY